VISRITAKKNRLVDDDDDPMERFSDTRILVIAEEDDVEQDDMDERCRAVRDSDVDSV
jgi:hypothetical protein